MPRCTAQDAFLNMGLTPDNAQDRLLPSTGTWLLDGSLEEALTLSHPINPETLEEEKESCVVKLRVKRSW